MLSQYNKSRDTSIGKGWLFTFTDLSALLLAFFVLVFSMSSVKEAEWEALTETLSRSLKPDAGVIKTGLGADKNIPGETRKEAINLDYLAAILETQIVDSPQLGDHLVHFLEERMVISLPGDLLFETGVAVLSESGQGALNELGSILRNVTNRVSVFGHTDPTPVEGGVFASNWELSLSRAVAVANELRRAGYVKNIVAFGAAESHFGFLSPELTQQQRADLARRVDIVISSKTGAQ